MIAVHPNQPRQARHIGISLCLWGLAALAQPVPRVLDRAVASVQGRVITASQLDFEARVLLVNAGGVEAAFAELDDEALRASLEAVVDQRLALVEADKLEAYPLDAGELERATAAFRTRLGSEARFAAFLARAEASLEDLSEVLRRGLRAQRALEGKLRLRAQVSEREARAYQKQRPDLRDTPLEDVRAMLVQQRFVALVKRELAEQRRQVDVRLLGPYAPRPEGQERR